MIGMLYEFDGQIAVCIETRDWDREGKLLSNEGMTWRRFIDCERVGASPVPFTLKMIDKYNKTNPEEVAVLVMERRLLKRSTEFMHAMKLADLILDKPGEDPDSDISVLSRQFLRLCETMSVMLAENYSAWAAAADQAGARLEPTNRERQRIEAAAKLARKNMFGFHDEQIEVKN